MGGEGRLARADVVVVGAGIMGASIAFQLAGRAGRKVAVVDARPPVGGMSGRTFGQIRQHYSNALMVRMAMRGFEVLNDMIISRMYFWFFRSYKYGLAW